jgi:hypothetical protein
MVHRWFFESWLNVTQQPTQQQQLLLDLCVALDQKETDYFLNSKYFYGLGDPAAHPNDVFQNLQYINLGIK